MYFIVFVTLACVVVGVEIRESDGGKETILLSTSVLDFGLPRGFVRSVGRYGKSA